MSTARLPENKHKLNSYYIVIRFKQLRAKRGVLFVLLLVEENLETDIKRRSILYHMKCFVRSKHTKKKLIGCL